MQPEVPSVKLWETKREDDDNKVNNKFHNALHG